MRQFVFQPFCSSANCTFIIRTLHSGPNAAKSVFQKRLNSILIFCARRIFKETQKEVYVLNQPAGGIHSMQDLIERDRSCFIE